MQNQKGSLNELSKLSRVPFTTLKHWRSNNKWVKKRKEFQDELYQQTELKAIDKVREDLSQQWATLTTEHLHCYQICRKTAELRVKLIQQQFEKLKVEEDLRRSMGMPVEEIEQAQAEKLKQISIDDINTCSIVPDRYVKGERIVLSMDYLDINRAIVAVERTRLKVVSPSDVALRQGVSNG
ncbi:MAG: hypothetical protein KME18_19105 [Phormidium tanganyikae FI6-MK23]|nr:hypothetical protein [Phormidium tanganyikae FI6-MK23]